MEDSFRRVFRLFTNRHPLRHSEMLSREPMLEQLSRSMDTTCSIALREHLDLQDGLQEEAGDQVSLGEESGVFAEEEYLFLEGEIDGRFDDFREKWAQRLDISVLLPLLEEGGWIGRSEQGYFLDMGGSEKEVRDLFYHTLHFMTGDAEKLVVMTCSRALHLQERVLKHWYAESVNTSSSQILPTLEASLREMETAIMTRLRGALSELALRRFSLPFEKVGEPVYYSTREELFARIGGLWNSLFFWESGFRAFMEDYTEFVRGSCREILEWYRGKWQLYLRGWTRGQLELFSETSETR